MFGFGTAITCPHCNQIFFGGPWPTTTDTLVSDVEGVTFLVDNAASRNWQSLWAKMKARWTITAKGENS